MEGVQVVCETNEAMASFRFTRVCPSRGIPINTCDHIESFFPEKVASKTIRLKGII